MGTLPPFNCCGSFMELKAAYNFGVTNWAVFQCKKCGAVMEKKLKFF